MDYGRITKFDNDRAFGFIAPDRGGPDVFFHVSGLDRGTDQRALRPGAQVSFEESSGPKGVKATRVRVLVSREEDRWPEYAAQSPAAPSGDDPWAEAWEAARKAFWDVLVARGVFGEE